MPGNEILRFSDIIAFQHNSIDVGINNVIFFSTRIPPSQMASQLKTIPSDAVTTILMDSFRFHRFGLRLSVCFILLFVEITQITGDTVHR